MSDKDLVKKKMNEIIRLASEFCDEYLNSEYKRLCIKLVKKMSRKHKVPFLRGRLDIWAASVIHALGQLNFLFDQNTKPYVSTKFIADYFNTSTSTTGQKAKRIRDMFRLKRFDDEFSTASLKNKDPFSNFVSLNGFIVPKKFLPPSLRNIGEENKVKEKKIVKEYRKYRERSNIFIRDVIFDFIDQSVLQEASKILGFNIQTPQEEKALIDFTLFDYKKKGKSFIAHYENKVTENEKEMWENLLDAYTSLFKVKEVLRGEKLIILQDLLNASRTKIKLIDINLSQTILPQMLLFTRVIPFKNFKVTSGINFIFQNDLENKLLEEYRSFADTTSYDDIAMTRFISFFKLNRKYGKDVFSRDIES